MKAIGYFENLPIDHLQSLVEIELPKPLPQPMDLVVQVRAISVNPVDTKVRRHSRPENGVATILGWDVAGVVDQVGVAVHDFSVGDEVYYAGSILQDGANGEFHRVDSRLVAKKPKQLSFAEAAAIPLTALTAYEALFERMGIDPGGKDHGSTLLIIGGAGGVGSIAIQMARLAGLKVIASASRPESTAWCLQMGASHVVDHSRPLLPQLESIGVSGVHFIFNTADTEMYWQSMAEIILPLGRICSIVETTKPLDLELLKSKSASFAWEFMFTRSMYGTPDMHEQGRILGRVADWLDTGQLKTTLTEELSPISVETLKQAHAKMESGKSIGKTILSGWK
jgi:NADPH2:quinone reductase